MRSLKIGLLIIGFFLFSFEAYGRINPKKLNKTDWLRVESPHFLVVSNGGSQKTFEIIQELERFNYFISRLSPIEQQAMDRKIPVVLAKNRSTFLALGMPNNILGLFSSSEGGIVFAQADKFKSSKKGKGSLGRTVILHELVHVFMANSAFETSMPAWYVEGTAEYYSTFNQKNDAIYLGEVSILRERFKYMRAVGSHKIKNIDTESLFKTEQSELKLGEEGSRSDDRFVNEFYARSAAVIHYLNSGSQLKQKMYTYLTFLNKGVSVDDAFKHAFEMSFSEFDQHINDYINGQKIVARVFPIGDNALMFPAVGVDEQPLSKQQALGFLYMKLTSLSPDFFGEANWYDINKKFDKVHPDFSAFRRELENLRQGVALE